MMAVKIDQTFPSTEHAYEALFFKYQNIFKELEIIPAKINFELEKRQYFDFSIICWGLTRIHTFIHYHIPLLIILLFELN
jgi:uncharacterized membrane protein YesL